MSKNEDLEALLDNELPEQEENRIFELMTTDPLLRKRYEDLQMQKVMVIEWFRRMYRQ